MRPIYRIAIFLTLLLGLYSCRGDVEIVLSEEVVIVPNGDTNIVDPNFENSAYQGFYLLNEGNMGTNMASLDYFDFSNGKFHRNIFAERNPGVIKEMGDVGNDIGIYGSKLYCVINVSNKIDVLDARSAVKLGQINIPNCRYIRFHGGYAYVTSYAGPVKIDPNYEQRGFVAKVDTTTYEEVERCLVGFQPDELEIVDGKIYVANSGGYMGAGGGDATKRYERTVSVIDLESFTEMKRIDVEYNLEHVKVDKRGDLWVSSRGDYYTLAPKLFLIDHKKDEVVKSFPVSPSNYWIDGDSLYVYGVEFSYITMKNTISFAIINTLTHEIVTRQIVQDGSDKLFEKPYGIMVHPETKDIYITDAGNYVTPGVLYCYSKEGYLKWGVRTGNIPGHFCLLPKKLDPNHD